MKTLIIFEKPNQEKQIMESKHLQSIIKDKNPTTVTMFFISNFVFEYPKNKKYNEYPLIEEVKYKNIPYLKELEEEYDQLIIATDPDYTGHYIAAQLLLNQYGENWKSKFKEIIIYDYYSEYSKNNSFIAQMEDFDKNVKNAESKYFFDYNYNLNSQVLFKEIINKLDLSKKNITITKYMTLSLWLIQKENLTDLHNIVRTINNYKGSGKYSDSRIGSPASLIKIINNLRNIGLISGEGITIKGEVFLNNLVKNTFDPDISQRLFQDKDQISKYIMKVFGRQKNKNKVL